MNGKVHTSFFNCNKTRVTEIYLRCKGKKKKKTEEKVIGVFKNKEHIFKKSQKKFFYTIRSFECTKKFNGAHDDLFKLFEALENKTKCIWMKNTSSEQSSQLLKNVNINLIAYCFLFWIHSLVASALTVYLNVIIYKMV